jgi:hypothetical protein
MSPFFPTVVVSWGCSVRMRLGYDHVYLSAAPMLIAPTKPGESRLVITSAGISTEKKCPNDNQAHSLRLS